MKQILEQKLADARERRDQLIRSFKITSDHRRFNYQFRLEHKEPLIEQHGPDAVFIDFGYQIVSAQGAVDHAKKALYIWLRQNGETPKHKDL